jgi:hypothetical protein
MSHISTRVLWKLNSSHFREQNRESEAALEADASGCPGVTGVRGKKEGCGEDRIPEARKRYILKYF